MFDYGSLPWQRHQLLCSTGGREHCWKEELVKNFVDIDTHTSNMSENNKLPVTAILFITFFHYYLFYIFKNCILMEL